MSTVTSRTPSYTSSSRKEDAVAIEPDDAWKVALRDKIEDGLASMVAEARKKLHDELDKEPVSSTKREELTKDYHNAMNSIRLLAAEAFQSELERERQERRWVNGGEMLPLWTEALKQEQQDIMDRIKVSQKEAASPTTAQPLPKSPRPPRVASTEPGAEPRPKGPVPVELPPDLAEKREKQLREERREKERAERERERKQTERQERESRREQEREEQDERVDPPQDQGEGSRQQDLERERAPYFLRGPPTRRGSFNRNPTGSWEEPPHPPLVQPRQPHQGTAERQSPPDTTESDRSSETEAESLLRPPDRPTLSRKSSNHERSLDSPITRSPEHSSRLSSERYAPRSPTHPQIWKPSSPEEDIVSTRPPSAGLARRNSSTSIRSTGSGNHRPSIAEPIPERSDSEAEHGERSVHEVDHPWPPAAPKSREKEKRREHRKSSASDQSRLEEPPPPTFSNARTPHRQEDPYSPPPAIRERYEDPPISFGSPRVQYRSEDMGPRLPSNMRPMHHKTSFTSEEWEGSYQSAPPRSIKSRPSFDDRYLHTQPPTPSGRVISRPPSIPSEERERAFYEQLPYRPYPTPPTSAGRQTGRDYPTSQGWHTNRIDSSPIYGYGENRSNTYKFAQQSESPPKRRSSESRPNQNRDPLYAKAFSEEPYQVQGSPSDSYGSRQYDRPPSASIPISRHRHSPALEEPESWKSWSSEVSASIPRREMRRDSDRRGAYGYDREDMQPSREQDYPRRSERDYDFWEPAGREAGYSYARQYGPPPEPPRREYNRPGPSPSPSLPSSQHEALNHSFGGRNHYFTNTGDSDVSDERESGSEATDMEPEHSWEDQNDYTNRMPEKRTRTNDMRSVEEFRVRETRQGQDRSNKSMQHERESEEQRRREMEAKQQEEVDRAEAERQEVMRQEETERRLEEEREEEEERRLQEEARRLQEEAKRNEEEAQRKAEEAKKLQEEARRKVEEAKKLQEAKRKTEEEAKKLEKKEAEIRRKEIETKKKAEEVRRKEEEASKKEQEAKRKEAEAKKKEVQAKRKEEEAKRKEEEAKRKEEEAKRKEDEARQKEEEAHRREMEAQSKEQETRKKEEEIRQKEEELKKREEELTRREQEMASLKEAERLQREWELEEEQKRQDEKFRRDQEEFRKREQEIRQKAEERKRQDSFGTDNSWGSSSHTPSTNQRTHPQTPTGTSGNGQVPGWSNNSARTPSKPSTTTGPSASPSSMPKPRSGSINSTFPSAPTPSAADESEWRRRQEEQYQKQQERFREEQQRYENARQRAQSNVLSKEETITLHNHHERQWSTLLSSSLNDLRWDSIPWPMFKSPKSPEDITMGAVSAYMQSQHFPDKSKSYKDRLKEHIRKWHPDRFDTKYLPRVIEEDRERVKDGAGSVVRTLNELLTRSNVPSAFS